MIIAQGDCGVTEGYKTFWRLDDQGTLTVYGEGKMHISFVTPWDEYADAIKKFIVERGITIVSVTLKNYHNLTYVEFSDTLIYDFCMVRKRFGSGEIRA